MNNRKSKSKFQSTFKSKCALYLGILTSLLVLLGGCSESESESESESGSGAELKAKSKTNAVAAETECDPSRFASAFVAYREASDKPLLWQQAECHLGIPANLQEAYVLQAAYVHERAKTSEVIGYKVALGSGAAQQLLGAPESVVGVLFDTMLVPSGSTLSRTAAKRIAIEADLLVTVKSAAINEATTIKEVAPHIASISAYIEIPDLMLPLQNGMATRFVATNAAAFKGVVGDSIEISDTNNRLQDLALMQVEFRDGEGNVLASRPGRSLMGHPYNAVLFLISALRRDGKQLQAGDVVSLGAYSKPIPIDTLSAEALKKISVHYLDLVDQKNNTPLKAEVFF